MKCSYHIVFNTKYTWRSDNAKQVPVQIIYAEAKLIARIINERLNSYDLQLVSGNILNDHVHLLIEPTDKLSVEKCIKEIKGSSAFEINKLGIERKFQWAKSFGITAITDPEHFFRAKRYIQENHLGRQLSWSQIEHEEIISILMSGDESSQERTTRVRIQCK